MSAGEAASRQGEKPQPVATASARKPDGFWHDRMLVLTTAAQKAAQAVQAAEARLAAADAARAAVLAHVMEARDGRLAAAHAALRAEEAFHEVAATLAALEQVTGEGLAEVARRLRQPAQASELRRARAVMAQMLQQRKLAQVQVATAAERRQAGRQRQAAWEREVAARSARLALADGKVAAARQERLAAELVRQEVERRQAGITQRIASLRTVLAQTAWAMLPAVPIATSLAAESDREQPVRTLGALKKRRLVPDGLLSHRMEPRPVRAALPARMADKRVIGSAAKDRLVMAAHLAGRKETRPVVERAGLLPITGVVHDAGHAPPDGLHDYGIIIVATVGQTVSAPVGGSIAFAGSFKSFGLLLIIDQGNGYHTLLAGLTQLDVEQGASIVAGQAVGKIAAHGGQPARLYMELRYRGVPVSPIPWLAAGEDKVRG